MLNYYKRKMIALVFFLFALFAHGSSLTCSEMKGLYSDSDCCTNPQGNICESIPNGMDLANVFRREMYNITSETSLESDTLITSDNIDTVGWRLLDGYAFQNAQLLDNLQKNLAVLSILSPDEFKAILSLDLN